MLPIQVTHGPTIVRLSFPTPTVSIVDMCDTHSIGRCIIMRKMRTAHQTVFEAHFYVLYAPPYFTFSDFERPLNALCAYERN